MFASVNRRISELTALYRGFGPAARRAVLVLFGIELVVIAAIERDIGRRPATRIRGPKLLWRVVATQNLVGPAAYLILGRRRTP
jgi:hypothetical protein